jgi:two-component system LytT family sensor kinase
VEDDGVGMAEGRAREVGFVSRGAGIGMRNVRERLEVLYGNSARFDVFSRPGRGTRVTLEIPMAPNVLVLADQTSARASTLS